MGTALRVSPHPDGVFFREGEAPAEPRRDDSATIVPTRSPAGADPRDLRDPGEPTGPAGSACGSAGASPSHSVRPFRGRASGQTLRRLAPFPPPLQPHSRSPLPAGRENRPHSLSENHPPINPTNPPPPTHKITTKKRRGETCGLSRNQRRWRTADNPPLLGKTFAQGVQSRIVAILRHPQIRGHQIRGQAPIRGNGSMGCSQTEQSHEMVPDPSVQQSAPALLPKDRDNPPFAPLHKVATIRFPICALSGFV